MPRFSIPIAWAAAALLLAVPAGAQPAQPAATKPTILVIWGDDTGPLTRKRMETVDEEFLAAGLAWMEKQTQAGTPWIVEEGRVRFVRADGNGEHVIETLDEDRIDVDLPIGVHAIYKRAS